MLIMENSEEVLQILERFTKLKQKDIPKELEDYLSYVAKTGDTVYRWASIKYLFREKLMSVIKDFHDSSPSVDDLPQYPNVDPFNYENMKSALLERLELFNAAPFTIQRLCELLTDPRKQYARIDKYMRALEKNILVVSTVEPGRKQSDNENGDSLDSVVIEDLSLESLHVDIDMDNDNIFSMQSQQQNSSHGNLSIINQDSGNNSITAANNSSVNNEITSSTSKNDDENGPATKKLKLDVTADDSLDGKSKSESESDDTSDDSDSLDEKECSKEEQQSDGEKSTTDSAETEKSESNSITESDIKLQEENEEPEIENEQKELPVSDLDENEKLPHTPIKTTNEAGDHQTSTTTSLETNLQETNEELDITSTSLTTANAANNLNLKELNETSSLEDEDSEKKHNKETDGDVNTKNFTTNLDKELEQTVKENAENIPDVSTETVETGKETKNVTEESLNKDDHQEKEISIGEKISSKESEKETVKVEESEEKQKVQSLLINETYVENSLPVTEKVNPENSFSLDDSKTVNVVETVTIPESLSTVTDKMKEEQEEILLSKVPEQMSVEEPTPQIATHMISGNEHLLEQQQTSPDRILSTNSTSSSILSPVSSNSILTHAASSSNNSIIDNKMQMDEHVDPGTATTCALVNINPIDDEVVMQSENEMATDPIKMTEDKGNDLTGMDIDDTSQEEAMDQ